MSMAVLLSTFIICIILIRPAYCYANEEEVGKGLKEAFESGIKRKNIFVTTKLWGTYASRVEEGLEKSLKNLGLDYVDLFLMHWPVALNPKGFYGTLARRQTSY
jgi:diketogulonate reductase-like aldo/keto reductase